GDALPGKEEELRRKARELFGPDIDAMRDFENDFPAWMNRRFRTPEEAHEFLRPFVGLARMEVRDAPMPADTDGQLALGLWQGHESMTPPAIVGSTIHTAPTPPRPPGWPTRKEIEARVLDSEADFLQFLSADPLDNKLRFRYVVWLSHRDPSRAEYLR